MAKTTADPYRSRPLSLDYLSQFGLLKDFKPPTGKFDPGGAWTQSYHLWLVQSFLGGGALTLQRTPTEGGARLDVTYDVAEYTGYIRRTKVELDCKGDALCSPTKWTLKSSSFDVDDTPIKGSSIAEVGGVQGGKLEVTFASRTRRETFPAPATSNWSLFDAVQRLPGKATKPLSFTLLEEMDLIKPRQRLEFREERDFKAGGTTLHLRGYQHVGEGVLPWQYWVDAAGRLLFAFSGVRAFIYDPQATVWVQKKLDTARTRTRRKRQGQKK